MSQSWLLDLGQRPASLPWKVPIAERREVMEQYAEVFPPILTSADGRSMRLVCYHKPLGVKYMSRRSLNRGCISLEGCNPRMRL